jgi:hypothetical protein
LLHCPRRQPAGAHLRLFRGGAGTPCCNQAAHARRSPAHRRQHRQAAILTRAILSSANLSEAILKNANFSGAFLFWTVFGAVDLSSVIGLETCIHHGWSIIDHRTLERSGPLPLSFFRGVGLPDSLIEYLPSLLRQAIQHYSCFISYSTKDQEFAERLHADLQNKGVRCWFAPHDLPIGAKTWDAIE